MVSLGNPSLATRIRNSASGIRTMHSPGPPAQEIAWRHGTAGRSTSCAYHHAYPIRTPKLGCVIHVGGCTTRSLDTGKALSHSPTSLYIHIRLISFLHRNILITRYTCLGAFVAFVPANIDANLSQCLTSIKKLSTCSTNGRSSRSYFSSYKPARMSSRTTFSQLATIVYQSLIKAVFVVRHVSKTIRKHWPNSITYSTPNVV